MSELLPVFRGDRVGRPLSVLLLIVWILLGFNPGAVALNTSVDVAQYKHTTWKIRDGFVGGFIQAFAQTRDGYLWLGTTDGLYRFDGIKAVRWDPPATATVRNISGVLALVAARDGTLWIASAGGLLTLKDGTFALVETPGRRRVNRMVEDDRRHRFHRLGRHVGELGLAVGESRETVLGERHGPVYLLRQRELLRRTRRHASDAIGRPGPQDPLGVREEGTYRGPGLVLETFWRRCPACSPCREQSPFT